MFENKFAGLVTSTCLDDSEVLQQYNRTFQFDYICSCSALARKRRPEALSPLARSRPFFCLIPATAVQLSLRSKTTRSLEHHPMRLCALFSLCGVSTCRVGVAAPDTQPREPCFRDGLLLHTAEDSLPASSAQRSAYPTIYVANASVTPAQRCWCVVQYSKIPSTDSAQNP